MARRRNRKVYNALDRKGKVAYTKKLKALITTMSKDLNDGHITRDEILEHKAFKHYTPEEREGLDDTEIVNTLAEYAVMKGFADAVHATVDEKKDVARSVSEAAEKSKESLQREIDELQEMVTGLGAIHDEEEKAGRSREAAEINQRINAANFKIEEMQDRLSNFDTRHVQDVDSFRSELTTRAKAKVATPKESKEESEPSAPSLEESVAQASSDIIRIPDETLAALELIAANVIDL
jgi:vacuolar-type H+-ATPase subunit I/STV1